MSKTEDDHNNCASHGMSRRDFVQMSTRLGLLAAATAALGSSCRTKKQEPALKIGYLPITDASPMLIGHSQGFFEQEGLVVEKPALMRGWPEVAEGFLAGHF